MGFRPARRQQPKGRMGSACQEMCIQTLGEREPGTERLEQDHRGIKGRYRAMRGFKYPRSAAQGRRMRSAGLNLAS
jgi:transposase-like protein